MTEHGQSCVVTNFMIGSLVGCDTMSDRTWHDMASHPKSLKSAVILLSQPPISYGLYCLVAGYRELMGRNTKLQTT